MKTTATADIPYAVVALTSPDVFDTVTVVAGPVTVVVEPATVTTEVVPPSWLSGQSTPQVLFTSLQPMYSWPHCGSAVVGAQFPVSMPPVSIV